MAGIRGKESYLVKINTGTEASPVWTALEGLQPGLTFNYSRDAIETTTLDNTTNVKTYISGDSDFSISGTFNIVPGKTAQEKVLSAAMVGGDGKIKVQWAETVGTGEPLHTADMVVTTGTDTVTDPLTFAFEFKLMDEPVTTTQA